MLARTYYSKTGKSELNVEAIQLTRGNLSQSIAFLGEAYQKTFGNKYTDAVSILASNIIEINSFKKTRKTPDVRPSVPRTTEKTIINEKPETKEILEYNFIIKNGDGTFTMMIPNEFNKHYRR